MRKALTAVVSLVALTVAAEATEPGDFDIGSGQHHVDIHAGALPIEHDENAACERVFHSGSVANEPADCEMNENKSKRKAERLWPKVQMIEGRNASAAWTTKSTWDFGLTFTSASTGEAICARLCMTPCPHGTASG
jgi:hypothetical protein